MNAWSLPVLYQVGQSTPCCARYFRASGSASVKSADTNTTRRPSFLYARWSFTISGNSSRHGSHQLAHTLTTVALPPLALISVAIDSAATGANTTSSARNESFGALAVCFVAEGAHANRTNASAAARTK